MESYRIVFAGTPDFAAVALSGLLGSNHQIVAVYTQPDRPAGRGRKLNASPVKVLAEQNGISIEQPETFKGLETVERLADYQADFMIVAAYGLILPQKVLDTPKFCCLNIHASLLPRWRGAAPIQRAIIEGDQHTGVSIMKMEAGLDCGDVLLQQETVIEDTDTGSSLHDRLAQMGSQSLLSCLDNFPVLMEQRCPQDSALITYAGKISKEEARINWNDDSVSISRLVRAFNGWPIAFSSLNGLAIRIWEARPAPEKHPGNAGTIVRSDNDGITVNCGEGALIIDKLQLPGKKALPVEEVLKSKKELFEIGKRFE